MTAPRVEIDLDKIRYNTQHLVHRLDLHDISVTAVTKAVCGCPDIAKAMLEGGAIGLADTHVENVDRMRAADIQHPICLIRTPMLSQADCIPPICDASYNTELDVIHALGQSALRANKVHGVILMVELGDQREGILPDDLSAFALKVMEIPGISLNGIGANFACLSGIAPEQQAITRLSDLASAIEEQSGLPLKIVSGGNSANLPLIFSGAHSGRINNLRLGEAILLGVDPVSEIPIEGLFTDAFNIVAEVIESRFTARRCEAPAIAPVSQHNQIVCIHDHTRRAIVAIGRQDTDIEGLSLPSRLTLIGATSDHLIVGTPYAPLAVGSEISFQPNYSALMRVMAAPNVEKVTRDRRHAGRGKSAENAHPNQERRAFIDAQAL